MMDSFFDRDVIVEEVRWLMNQGYRGREIDIVERGIARCWHQKTFWESAAKESLANAISQLATVGRITGQRNPH